MKKEKLEIILDKLLIKLEKKYTKTNDMRFIKLMSEAERLYEIPFIGKYCERYNKIIEKYGNGIFENEKKDNI